MFMVLLQSAYTERAMVAETKAPSTYSRQTRLNVRGGGNVHVDRGSTRRRHHLKKNHSNVEHCFLN